MLDRDGSSMYTAMTQQPQFRLFCRQELMASVVIYGFVLFGIGFATHESAAMRNPLTPVTPVTIDAFMSLRDLIFQQDGHALDNVDKKS